MNRVSANVLKWINGQFCGGIDDGEGCEKGRQWKIELVDNGGKRRRILSRWDAVGNYYCV